MFCSNLAYEILYSCTSRWRSLPHNQINTSTARNLLTSHSLHTDLVTLSSVSVHSATAQSLFTLSLCKLHRVSRNVHPWLSWLQCEMKANLNNIWHKCSWQNSQQNHMEQMSDLSRDVPDFSFPNPAGVGFGQIYDDKSGRSRGRRRISEFSST